MLGIRTSFFLCATLVASACSGSGGGDTPIVPPPTGGGSPDLVTELPTVNTPIAFNDLAVHDPSVVRADDDSFYVIGSHLAMARSLDLVTWNYIAEGVNDANPLFNTYATEIAEGIDYVGGWVGSWASSIIQLADGRWYFYYDHCATADDGACDYPRSYLGVAVSDNIDGPYTDLGVFLWSGQTDDEIANGFGVGEITTYDPGVHPNVIDPHAFYDADGRLWMVYGSYSGGIFILEMDETRGKPVPDQGFGQHLAGGSHSAIEGPYILYSPETDYYYLFTSFGGFAANDGYNVRIARSRNPDGPYVDAAGNDMTLARGGWDGIAPYGVKVMGGHEFVAHVGDSNPGWGYLSPGHNSAYYDADTGKHLLIEHTRFPNRGEEHAIRVHELFVTDDDWLVASPHRYVPMTGGNSVSDEDAVGTYRYINHGKDINRTAKQSAYVALNADLSISGAATGSYAMSSSGGHDISLTIDGVTYSGMIFWQWDDSAQQLTAAISALADDGATIWLSQMENMPTATVLDNIGNALEIPPSFAGDSLSLPTEGTRGAVIAWSTSDADTISPTGTVVRPNVDEGDATVTLTATISLDGQESSAEFDVTVPQRSPFNRIASYDFDGDLTDSLGNFPAARTTGDRIWAVEQGAASYLTGHDGQAVHLDGTSGIRLPDGLVGNYEYSVSFWANPTVITQFTTAFFGAVNEQQDGDAPTSNSWISMIPQGWDGYTMFWSGSEPWFDGITNTLIPQNAWSHLGFSVNRGLVRVFINGQEFYSGGNLTDFFTYDTGLFALGVNYWDAPYNGLIDELRIYDAALEADEIRALDVVSTPSDQLLQIAADLLDLGDLSATKEDLYLPPTGAFAAAVEWLSSDPTAIEVQGTTGIVTRPGAGVPDAQVTLTATVTLDGQSTTRDFIATVSNLGIPIAAAAYAFENNLDDSLNNFASGTATGSSITAAGGNVSFTDGVIGRALVLDGNTGVALDANLVTDDTYTLSMWLNPASLPFYTTALFGGPDCAGGAATCDSWISVVPGGVDPGGDTMLWSGTAWYDATTGTSIPTGQWTHFVAVNDGGNVSVYLNGAETFSGANFPDVFTGTLSPRFWIGVNHWDPAYNGAIDELQFYDEALTADEVTQLYEAQSPPDP